MPACNNNTGTIQALVDNANISWTGVPTSGLVAEYLFDGDANNTSGNGDSGTVIGAILTSDRYGNANSAYYLDGVDDYITIPASSEVSSNNDFTISLWFQTTDAWAYILDERVPYERGYGLTISGDPIGFSFGVQDGIANGNSVFPQIAVNNGKWHNVIAVRKGTTLYLYVDGNLLDSKTGTLINIGSANTINIGKRYTNTAAEAYYDGIIDDLRIYNRALSDSEIQTLYNSEKPADNQSPIVSFIPNQSKNQNDSAWTVDLTAYESDTEDSGTDLDWSVSDVDTTLISAVITDSDEDILTITPVVNASGSDTITLTLTDSGGLTATQNIIVTLAPDDYSGSGTAESPFRIYTPNQFNKISQNVEDKSKWFILMNDLDMDDLSGDFTPISAFSGIFDGRGHVIRNLTIDLSGQDNIGLFASTTSSSVIMNVGLESVSILGGDQTGALVGDLKGVAMNCYSTGTVTGDIYVGGLFGRVYDAVGVANCYSRCDVSGNDSFGGLVGYNYSTTFVASYFAGTVPSGAGICGVETYSTCQNTFWDTEIAQTTTSAGGQGVSTAELKDVAFLALYSWNLDTVWQVEPGVNDGYPTLRKLHPVGMTFPEAIDGVVLPPDQTVFGGMFHVYGDLVYAPLLSTTWLADPKVVSEATLHWGDAWTMAENLVLDNINEWHLGYIEDYFALYGLLKHVADDQEPFSNLLWSSGGFWSNTKGSFSPSHFCARFSDGHFGSSSNDNATYNAHWALYRGNPGFRETLDVLLNQSITGYLTASSQNPELLTYSIVSNGSKGTATITDASTGAFTYTHTDGEMGTDTFTFKVNNGTVDSNTATVTVAISTTNNAPTVSDGAFFTDEDTVYGGTLSANDADADVLTYSIVTNGTKGTVTITDAATGAFTYSPAPDENGSDSFTFKVNDGTVDSNSATMTVTIFQGIDESFETGDFSAFSWSIEGNGNWEVVGGGHLGSYSARAFADWNQTTSLALTLYITDAGDISFWFKVIPDNWTGVADYLNFYIDDELIEQWNEADWTQTSYSVSPGVHTFKWVRNNGGGDTNANDDFAWLDDIIFPPYSTDLVPSITAPTATLTETTSVSMGATVSNAGGCAVTERGVYWSLTDGFVPPANATKVSEEGAFGAESFTLDVGDLPQGTTIYFRAFAANEYGMALTSQGSLETKPSTPQHVSALDLDDPTRVTVTWETSQGAEYYKIYRSTSHDPQIAEHISTGNDPVSCTYVDVLPASGTLFYYWVSACSSVGESAWSFLAFPGRTLLDPSNFVSSGTLNPAVNLTINMGTGVMTGDGLEPITAYDLTEASAPDGTARWVFCFDTITISEGIEIQFISTPGDRCISLLSRGTFQLDGLIASNGLENTHGPGKRYSGDARLARYGGGASFGGIGGYPGGVSGGGVYPGDVFGDLTRQFSSGAAGSEIGYGGNGFGGGQGGAVELGSGGLLSISGTVNVSGGSGASAYDSGASGGGIILHGESVTLSATSSVLAEGGSGGDSYYNGNPGGGGYCAGGGGGGRILVLAHKDGQLLSQGSISVAGGAGGQSLGTFGFSGAAG